MAVSDTRLHGPLLEWRRPRGARGARAGLDDLKDDGRQEARLHPGRGRPHRPTSDPSIDTIAAASRVQPTRPGRVNWRLLVNVPRVKMIPAIDPDND